MERGEPMKYLVVIEKAESNYAAYIPDLPGCVATAATLNELHQNIRAAVAMHLECLREDGQPVPEPQTQAEFVEACP
jgi:predicted RNase H-like HicB family nuclease